MAKKRIAPRCVNVRVTANGNLSPEGYNELLAKLKNMNVKGSWVRIIVAKIKCPDPGNI